MSSGPAEIPPIAGGASLRLHLPAGAAPMPAGDLPRVDVANLPGASVPVRTGYRSGGIELYAFCATAPSSGWAPGVEELVLGRATGIARVALRGEVERLEVGDATPAGKAAFEQRFQGSVKRGGDALRVEGKHLLGFAGASRDGVLCTAVCIEPAAEKACAGIVAGVAAEGAWVGAPPPSVVVRGILAAAERPYAAAGVSGAIVILAIAIVLARRPRPRR
jgi:hypothetical protein